MSFKNFNRLWCVRVGLLRASLSLRQSLWLYCSLLSQFPNVWYSLHCIYPFHIGHKAVLRLASLAAPSASLTQILTHPLPLSFEKERGDMYYSTYYCSPSLTLLERGNKKGVSKNTSITQPTNCRWWLFTLSILRGLAEFAFF